MEYTLYPTIKNSESKVKIDYTELQIYPILTLSYV